MAWEDVVRVAEQAGCRVAELGDGRYSIVVPTDDHGQASTIEVTGDYITLMRTIELVRFREALA